MGHKIQLSLLFCFAITFTMGKKVIDELFDTFGEWGDEDGPDLEEFRKIIENNKDDLKSFINTREKSSGQTPLMKSVLMGHTEVVRILLDLEEVDVTIGEKDGYTPMHGAGFQGRADIVKLLAEKNIDPSEYHKDGYTPLHRACWGQDQRHLETVKMFVDVAKVPYNQKTKDGTKTCKKIAMHPGIVELMEKYEKEEDQISNQKSEVTKEEL